MPGFELTASAMAPEREDRRCKFVEREKFIVSRDLEREAAFVSAEPQSGKACSVHEVRLRHFLSAGVADYLDTVRVLAGVYKVQRFSVLELRSIEPSWGFINETVEILERVIESSHESPWCFYERDHAVCLSSISKGEFDFNLGEPRRKLSGTVPCAVDVYKASFRAIGNTIRAVVLLQISKFLKILLQNNSR